MLSFITAEQLGHDLQPLQPAAAAAAAAVAAAAIRICAWPNQLFSSHDYRHFQLIQPFMHAL